MSAAPHSPALRAAIALLLAQLALQVAWHAWLAPTSRAALALAALPLIPGLWLAQRDQRRGALIGAIASLLYFCHGVAELMRPSVARVLPAVEIALALAVVGALHAETRYARRRKAEKQSRSQD